MSSRQRAPEPEDDATATGPVAAVDTTDPSITRGSTIVQPFLGENLELTPAPTGPDVTLRAPPSFPATGLLGDSLEHTPTSTDPGLPARRALLGPGRLPSDEVEQTQASAPPAAAAPGGQDLALRLTDPAAAPPFSRPQRSEPQAAAPREAAPPPVPERRPAPPAPAPFAIVRLPPALPVRAPAPKAPGPVDASADVSTLPLRPLRVSPPVPPPAAPPAVGPPRPRVDPLRERRLRAMRAKLVHLSSALLRRVEEKPPVWRVLALGVVAGLLVAGAAAFFYLRGRDVNPDAPASATHGPKLKDYGAQADGPDHSLVDSFDDAVDFSKKK